MVNLLLDGCISPLLDGCIGISKCGHLAKLLLEGYTMDVTEMQMLDMKMRHWMPNDIIHFVSIWLS